MTIPISSPPDVSHRGLLRIAVPMTLGYLTTPLVGIVAIGVIGRLGDPALSAGVALGSIVTDVLFSTCNFLRSGTTGLTAQATGRGDVAERTAVALRALMLAAAIGLGIVVAMPLILHLAPLALGPSAAAERAMNDYLVIRLIGAPLVLANFAVFGWLVGHGRAGMALVIQTVLNGVNLALALVLVEGVGLSVDGVAVAAVAADAIALAAGFVLTAPSFWRAGWPGRARLTDTAALRAMLAVNGDIMIRSFALLAAFTFFVRQGARQGDVILSANAILEKFFLVGGYFLDGVAAAAETFAGQAMGARDRLAFGRSVRLSLIWGTSLAVICAVVLFATGPWLATAMTTVPEVRAAAVLYLPWAALTPLAGVLAFQMDGIFIGATWSRDMRNMMLASLVLFAVAWAVLMPVFGNHGLWMAFLIFLGARGLSLAFFLPRRMRASFRSPLP